MASMMDEMAKTLARRRAAVEKKDSEVLQVRIVLAFNVSENPVPKVLFIFCLLYFP